MCLRAMGFNDENAYSLSDELFGDSYLSCKDKSYEDLKDNFKSLSALTKAEGQIKCTPKQKDRIRTFTYWVKDLYRLGKEPSEMKFPLEEMMEIKERARAHQAYVKRYETVSSAAKPQRFTKDMKWDDWAPSFVNYLRCIPSIDGIPLSYITRDQDEADRTPKTDFLEAYIASAATTGSSFTSDADQVHIYLMNMVAQNEEAEAIMKIHEHERNGRTDWKALTLHYEGQGLYNTSIAKAENDLAKLFYQGEKRPYMFWTMFERRLNTAFATFDKQEKRQVHSEQMRLRILLNKIQCDWLNHIKASIGIELTRMPMTYTYAQALLAFKTEVNKKFPPEASPQKIKRTMQQLEGHSESRNYGGGRGRGRGRGRGPGRGGRGRGGRGRNQHNPHPDAKMITLKNGKRVEYHASYSFPQDVYEQFTDNQIQTMRDERKRYKEMQQNRNNGSQRQIKEMQAQINDLISVASGQLSGRTNDFPSTVRGSGSVAISQMSSSIMGGRNEQYEKRKKSRRNESDEES